MRLRAQFIHNSVSIFKFYQKVREFAALCFDIFSQLLVFKDLQMPNCKGLLTLSQTLSIYTLSWNNLLLQGTLLPDLFVNFFVTLLYGLRRPRDYLCRCGGLCMLTYADVCGRILFKGLRCLRDYLCRCGGLCRTSCGRTWSPTHITYSARQHMSTFISKRQHTSVECGGLCKTCCGRT